MFFFRYFFQPSLFLTTHYRVKTVDIKVYTCFMFMVENQISVIIFKKEME